MARWEGRPAYLQIANDIRLQILSGELPPGAQIDSESALMRKYDVSRTVARMAIRLLQTEGAIVGHPGKGSFVKARNRIVRDASTRYSRKKAGSTSPFRSDAAKSKQAADWEHASGPDEAPSDVALRLQITPGDPVMRTAYRYYSGDQVIQLSTSWEPLEVTRGTDVERPEEGAAVGVIARMDHIGVRVTEVEERVNARSALPEEIESLDLPATGATVLTIARTHYAGNLPVETCDIVFPSDRYELTYRISVD